MALRRGRWLVVIALALWSAQDAAAQLPPPQPPAPLKLGPHTDRHGDPLPEGAVQRLGTNRFRHHGKVWALAVSADGTLLASGSNSGLIVLWDATTGKKRHELAGHRGAVHFLRFLPDGKTLLSAANDRQLIRWDVGAGKELGRTVPPVPFVTLAVAPDGQTAALGGAHGSVHLWDLAKGVERTKLTGHTGQVQAVAYAPDGKTLATGGTDWTVRLWDVAAGKELCWLGGHINPVNSLAFTPDGKGLVSAGTSDPVVRVWDVPTRTTTRRIPLPPHATARSLALDPAGRTLAVLSTNLTLRLFDLKTGRELHDIPSAITAQAGNGDLTFTPDGKRLFVTGGTETPIRVYDPATGAEILDEEGHRGVIRALAYSRDGRLIATGGQDNRLCVWEAATGRLLHRFDEHQNGIRAVGFSADGKTLLAAGGDRMVSVWDLERGENLRVFAGSPGAATAAAFSADGRLVAMVGSDRLIRVWDTAKATEVCRRAAPQGISILALAFSPDGKTLLAGGSNQALHLYDLTADAEPRHIPAIGMAQYGLMLTADGKSVAIGGGRQPALVELATGRPRWRLPTPNSGGAHFLAVTPDGRLVAWARTDGTILVWDTVLAQEVAAFRQLPSTHGTLPLAFAPDGRWLAAVQDSTVLIWDVRHLAKPAQPAGAPRTDKDLEALWNDLNGDAASAHRAIWALAGTPDPAVALIQARLRPKPAPDPERIPLLIRRLDSERYAEREQATEELANLGPLAEAALRQALAHGPSPEQRRRIEQLLARLQAAVLPPETVQAYRVVEVLERAGTPDARELLKTLAKGPPELALTQDARAALDRLAK
jgi:WD40 repeat protein